MPSASFLLGVLLASSISYGLALVVYRSFICPIAHFPGPKLTAITCWYETYYDVFKGGQFTFQIEKWHERYGQLLSLMSFLPAHDH